MRASFAVFLATLALVTQLLAPASHRTVASADIAGVAAELHAAFGDVVALCTHVSDDQSPNTPTHPSGPCDDCCPLCQSGAASHAFVLPALLGAPSRIEAVSETLGPAPDFVRLKPSRTAFAQPRAPPFEA
jgi:hypothetical protein